MKVSIVIPTYNERENVKNLIPAIFETFSKNKISGDVIVVDDNSPDGTSKVVERLKEEFPVTLIRRVRKEGIGSAYITGFREALNKADIIMEMDADLSHNPEDIPDLLRAIGNYDLVLGSRYIKGGRIEDWNPIRRLISKGGNLIARILLNLNINDITTGYRAYRRKVLEGIDMDKIQSDGYGFQAEMIFRARKKGFRVGEIPITFRDRRHGRSKLSKVEILKFIFLCINLRRRAY